jgi:hypothetical protein
MIREYFDSTRDIKKHLQESMMASTVYMWTPGLPLFKYRDDYIFKNDTNLSNEFKKWAAMGPMYKSYGLHIIKTYPMQFIKYFIWPNMNKYYAPPVEFLSSYNSGRKKVSAVAVDWFQYKNGQLKSRTNGIIKALDFYPILSGIINGLMLLNFIYYLLIKGWKYDRRFSKAVLISVSLWLLNAIFTIVASSAALRFQAFPILLTITFTLLISEWLWAISVREGQSTSGKPSFGNSQKTVVYKA